MTTFDVTFIEITAESPSEISPRQGSLQFTNYPLVFNFLHFFSGIVPG